MNDLSRNFVYGFVGSALPNPIDILRTHKQITPKETFAEIAKNIIDRQGLKGFYRGFLVNGIAHGIFFTIFASAKNNDVNTMLSANIASLIANPLYVLKTRYHTSALNKMRRPKFGELYKGIGITLIKNGSLAVQYEILDNTKLESPLSIAIATGITKTTISSITFPLDTVRVRVRNRETIKNIYHTTPLKSYWRGLSMYLLRAVPTSVLTFTPYFWFRETNNAGPPHKD
jgi:hypothetical protein